MGQRSASVDVPDRDAGLRRVLDVAPSPVFVCDLETGRIERANAAACAAFGLGPGAFALLRWQDLVAPESDTVVGVARDVHLYGLARVASVRFRRDDGRRFAADVTLRAVGATGVAVFLRELAEATPEPMSAREAGALLQARAAFTHASQPILVIDFDSALVIEANPAACKLFGYSQDEWRTKKGRDLHPSGIGDQVDLFSGWLKRRGRAFRPEIRCMRKDGTEFVAELTVSIFDGLDRRLMIVTIDDLSEIVSLREQVARLEAALDEAHGVQARRA
ncbi:MAG: PAS domain-containing protein [Myxococcota bacterium]